MQYMACCLQGSAVLTACKLSIEIHLESLQCYAVRHSYPGLPIPLLVIGLATRATGDNYLINWGEEARTAGQTE